MPAPQINNRVSTRERPTYSEMIWQQLQDTKTEIKDTRKELNARMDRIERRMDQFEHNLEATRKEFNLRMDKLADKIDAMHNEIKSSTNHGQIATISTVGIALGVLYSLLFK